MSQPSAGGQPPHQSYEQSAHPSAAGPGAEPPPPVRTAVKLMWAGAALALLGVLLVPLQTDAIRDQVAEQSPGLDIDAVVSAGIAVAVVVGLISVGLWVLMAVMNRKGKVWARITATVLAGLNIVFTLASISGATGTAPPALALVISVVSLILAGVIVYLLWQRPASEWFDAMGARSA